MSLVSRMTSGSILKLLKQLFFYKQDIPDMNQIFQLFSFEHSLKTCYSKKAILLII